MVDSQPETGLVRNNMITLTEAAAAQVKQSTEQSGAEDLALRIAVRKTHDGQFNYIMGFDDIASGGDFSIVTQGVTVVVDKDSRELLKGTTVDYVEIEPGEPRFIFLNPNDPDYVPPETSEEGSGEN